MTPGRWSRSSGWRPVARTANELVVGTVGGLRAEKDHSTLLQAVSKCASRPRVQIVGGGALAAALRSESASLGLGDSVEFVGPVVDTAPCYAGFALFVLSSRTEQMPIAMLEAMACGLPVIATDVGDVRAILPAEAADCLVPPGDAQALASALQGLLDNAPRRHELGAANRRRVEAHYDARTCLDRFARVYERSLAGNRPGSLAK